jgi:uncharacterized membrane protein
MTRKEFMDELRSRLSRLPADEKEEALSYYEEYFDEAGSDREQDVIRELGSPASVASRILADHAVKEAREAPYNPRKGFSAVWAVLLAIFAAPLAIPAVIAIIGIMIAILAVVFAVGAAAVGLLIGGFALFIGGFFGLFSSPASALIIFGVAFLLWGAGKIIFTIIGASLSLLGQLTSWMFGRTKGDGYAR